MFFNCFILPHFDYGYVIWAGRGNHHFYSLMAKLQVLHNKAARLILDLPSRASVSDTLEGFLGRLSRPICKLRPNRATAKLHIIDVKKSRKSSCFMIYSYF